MVPGFGRPVFAMDMDHFVKFECDCCEMLVFRVCGARQDVYVLSLYRNTDVDDRISDC